MSMRPSFAIKAHVCPPTSDSQHPIGFEPVTNACGN